MKQYNYDNKNWLLRLKIIVYRQVFLFSDLYSAENFDLGSGRLLFSEALAAWIEQKERVLYRSRPSTPTDFSRWVKSADCRLKKLFNTEQDYVEKTLHVKCNLSVFQQINRESQSTRRGAERGTGGGGEIF